MEFRKLIHESPSIIKARYAFLEAAKPRDEAMSFWEQHYNERPKYDPWLDALDNVPASMYQLEQRAPDSVDREAIEAYWEDKYSDRPMFHPKEDTINWLRSHPKMNLLTKPAFIRRLRAMGATKGEALEAWNSSNVRRVPG